jgi:hypothetical protein
MTVEAVPLLAGTVPRPFSSARAANPPRTDAVATIITAESIRILGMAFHLFGGSVVGDF